MIDRRLSVTLDQCRWLAALVVVTSHVRNLLFVNYAGLHDKGLALKLFYFVTGFGHEAVIVFFVISGMLVGGTALRDLREKRFDARDYFIRRFSRIYIVLIPALLMCYLFDNVGLAYFNNSQLYTHSEWYNFKTSFAARSSWDVLLGNVFMLHEVVVPLLGSNAPLWSLANEWWYYCLFCFAIGLANADTGRFARAGYAALILLLFVVLPGKMLVWFLIWLAGAALGVAPLSRFRINRAFSCIFFLGALVVARLGHADHGEGIYIDFMRDAAVAAGFCMVLISFSRRGPGTPETASAEAVHRSMAAFSYTTYLFHFPFMIFVAAFLNSMFGLPFFRQPSLPGFVYYVLMIGCIYLYTYAMSRLTEVHTGRLRKFLASGRGCLEAPKPVSSEVRISGRP